jgi:hypothetical protein
MRSHGCALTRDIAKAADLSQWRLIKVFTTEVGLTPKQFGRVQRFQCPIAQARKNLPADRTISDRSTTCPENVLRRSCASFRFRNLGGALNSLYGPVGPRWITGSRPGSVSAVGHNEHGIVTSVRMQLEGANTRTRAPQQVASLARSDVETGPSDVIC